MSKSYFPFNVLEFIDSCKIPNSNVKYASIPYGTETLYGSCFALMTLHYLNQLNRLSDKIKCEWMEYLNSFQDKSTGLFIGPELDPAELSSPRHDFNHISMHLTATVLPAMSLLEGKAKYPLHFAYEYLDQRFLSDWLDRRDWSAAWLEGNNILFIGEFLIYLRDREKLPEANESLSLIFSWLNDQIDPQTGLWGSNGFCGKDVALYGGYHQLLLYYHENKPNPYYQKLVDTALALQHPDGGFRLKGGGGACEDVDAIDILVNMYKQHNYKHRAIRNALRRAYKHLQRMQNNDGGYVYRPNEGFIHMGIKQTKAHKNQSNLFSTWFRVHTIALISEILPYTSGSETLFAFNDFISMGWHRKWDKKINQTSSYLDYVNYINTIFSRRYLKYYLKSIFRKTGFFR